MLSRIFLHLSSIFIHNMVGVVVVLGRMLELELGRSSCSDGGRLEVVVGLVEMGLLEVLVVREVQLVQGYQGFRLVLVGH